MIYKLISWCVLISSALIGCATAISEGDPLWRVVIVSRDRCNSIDGEYHDKGLLARQFEDSSIHPLKSKFSRTQKIRELPYSRYSGTEFREKRRRFNDFATTRIQKTPIGWEVELRGADGLIYEKTFISDMHENVGCTTDGWLVLRSFSLIQGGEGTAGSAHAAEVMFQKLGDGTLKVVRRSRNWASSMRLPPRAEIETSLEFSRK